MRYSLLLPFLLLSCLCASSAELRGSPEDLKKYLKVEGALVQVIGEAEIVAYSDTAIVTVVVSTKAKTLSEALLSNSEVRDRLVQAFAASGINSEQINNAAFSSSPQYGLFGKKPSSFEVVNRLTVSAKSEKQLQTISAIIDGTEEASIALVEFEDSRKSELETQAELAALDDARKTASKYQERLGLKLQPRSFSFDQLHARQSQSSVALEEIVVTATARERGSEYHPPASRPAPSFDEVRYQARVTVVFEVVD